MVPLVTLYLKEDGTAPELLGSAQDEVIDALETAGVEINLDACKLYASAKPGGGGGGGSSQHTTTTTTNTTTGTGTGTTRRIQSHSQATPPSKLLGVSGGGGGSGGGRSRAKKPGSRTPLAALNQKKKK